MLGGIFTRWKQIVAYHFTNPQGFDGTRLKPIIEKIIQKTEEINLYVHAVTSDMDASNQRIWRAFGINTHKYSNIQNSVPHFIDPQRKLYFFADGPHLLKNLRTALINNRSIILPSNYAESLNLSSTIVQCSHLEDLVAEQENMFFKFAPKLNKDILTTTQFNKMKVNKAVNVFNQSSSSALNYMSEKYDDEQYKTTATFIEIISEWFTVITSRHASVALRKKIGCIESENKFNEQINFLESIIELFKAVKIGKKKVVFKPVQTGILITTKSYIELTKYLIHERGFLYVLGSRFTNDFVEIVFSNLRKKFPTPNALQFQQSLKMLCVSQYMQEMKNTSYEQDNGEFLVDFLKHSRQQKVTKTLSEVIEIPDYIENKIITMNNHEKMLFIVFAVILFLKFTSIIEFVKNA